MPMPIKYIEGDLFAFVKAQDTQSSPILIPHVCNDKGGFGSGFVVPLGRTYPVVKQSYHIWCDQGTWSHRDESQIALPPVLFQLGNVQFVQAADNVYVANMVAQTLGGIRPLFYNHLARCMDQVAVFANETKAKIHAPMFGSQLAGGFWEFIESLIEDCWIRQHDLPVTIHYLEGSTPAGWVPPTE